VTKKTLELLRVINLIQALNDVKEAFKSAECGLAVRVIGF
jgi:hypothetical protein